MRCCPVVTRRKGILTRKLRGVFVRGGELEEGGQGEGANEDTED